MRLTDGFLYVYVALLLFVAGACTDSPSVLESMDDGDLVLLVQEIDRENKMRHHDPSFYTRFTLPDEANPFYVYKELEREAGTQHADSVFSNHMKEKSRFERDIKKAAENHNWKAVEELYETSLKELDENVYVYPYRQYMQYQLSKEMLSYLESSDPEAQDEEELASIHHFLYSAASGLSESGFPDIVFMSNIYSRLLNSYSPDDLTPMIKKSMVSARDFFDKDDYSYLNPDDPDVRQKIDEFFASGKRAIQE